MDTPDDNRMIVFKSGIFIGLNASIELGGHIWPISILGLIPLWKYVQKNDTKNITSDVMNKIIPIFSPLITRLKWNPWFFVSRITSFHHMNDMIDVKIIEHSSMYIFECVFHRTIEDNKDEIAIAVITGQGLIWTMWNEWNLLFIVDFCWV